MVGYWPTTQLSWAEATRSRHQPERLILKGQFTFSESLDIESPSVTASTKLLILNAVMFLTSFLLIIMGSDLSPSGEWHQSS
jgi:hypothetical protein